MLSYIFVSPYASDCLIYRHGLREQIHVLLPSPVPDIDVISWIRLAYVLYLHTTMER
jgi:hypothetical protein